jgi:hypothetical protein
MNATRDFEKARTPDDVVNALAAALQFWSRQELSRIVSGDSLPRVECVDDVEAWADRLEQQARQTPLLEPDESSREHLVRLFLLASVKLRLLDRLAASAPILPHFGEGPWHSTSNSRPLTAIG